MNLDLTTALEAAKPVITEDFAHYVRTTFARIVELHGPKLNKVYNCWTFASSFRTTIAPVVSYDADRNASINEAKLALVAEAYAEAAVAEWQGKIEAKLGELNNAEVTRFNGHGFTILGQRDGKSICIEQQKILKASSKGNVFHQFPARIYVNGKFTSEANYKKAFA